MKRTGGIVDRRIRRRCSRRGPRRSVPVKRCSRTLLSTRNSAPVRTTILAASPYCGFTFAASTNLRRAGPAADVHPLWSMDTRASHFRRRSGGLWPGWHRGLSLPIGLGLVAKSPFLDLGQEHVMVMAVRRMEKRSEAVKCRHFRLQVIKRGQIRREITHRTTKRCGGYRTQVNTHMAIQSHCRRCG